MKAKQISKNPDAIIFQSMKNRLNDDVGGLMDLLSDEFLLGNGKSKFANGKYPHWALIRMIMPIAESLAVLIYGDGGTRQNLLNLLEKDLSKYDINYKNFANVFILIYRHSLTHSDLLRGVICNGIQIGWSVGKTDTMMHLKVTRFKDSQYLLHYNHVRFFEHLNLLLNELIIRANRNEWNGKIIERYKKWENINFEDKDVRKRYKITDEEYKTILSEVNLIIKSVEDFL